MGVYRKIRFLSIEAEISTLDDFLALFMNRQIILSQKMGKKIFHRKQLATLSQRSPVKAALTFILTFSNSLLTVVAASKFGKYPTPFCLFFEISRHILFIQGN